MAPRLALLAALLLSPLARADVAPEPDPCDDKAAGAACDYQGSPGVCEVQTCSKLDYSQGSPPQTVEYECIKCAAAPPPDVPTSSGGCTVAPGGGALSLALLLLALGARRPRRRAAAGI